jgi:LCP family protein required for cell wall assembly
VRHLFGAREQFGAEILSGAGLAEEPEDHRERATDDIAGTSTICGTEYAFNTAFMMRVRVPQRYPFLWEDIPLPQWTMQGSLKPMVSRTKEAPRVATAQPVGRRANSRTAALRSSRERRLFTFALVVFAITSSWASLVLFARVYPALFPGQVLTDAIPVKAVGGALVQLPGPLKVEAPGANSVFNERINILVLGVDKRPQDAELGGYLTDSIMIATVDPVTKQASAVSFPRDLYIDHYLSNGGVFKGRINESYGLGFKETKSPDAGARQLERDIEKNFGIKVDYYVLLDFEGVEKLIDSIGGVELDIPYELSVPDWWYSNDDYSGRWVSFPPGRQRVDGYHAVAFGRYREDSDLYRVKRQQLVLQTAMAKAFSTGILNNDPFELYDAYVSTVKTDVPRARMFGFATLLKATGGELATYSVGDPVNGRDTVSPFTGFGGASVLEWDRENVAIILSQVFTKSQYANSTVDIRGGYGGGDDGEKADELARYLRFQKGLPAVFVAPDVAIQGETTIALYNEERFDMAKEVAGWLGLPTTAIKEAARPSSSAGAPDMVITIGRNYTPPK